MKRFLRKQLPAFLLAMVMVVGLMPSALAAHTHQWSSWVKVDDSDHQRTCQVSGCDATETRSHNFSSAYERNSDSHWKKCTDCGALTAPTAHSFSSSWQHDSDNHWKVCTCGAQKYLGGHVDQDENRLCDTCGARMSGTPSKPSVPDEEDVIITYKVDAGEAVEFDRDDFEKAYEDVFEDDNFRYVDFDPGTSYKSTYGVIYYNYDGKEETSFSKSKLGDFDFYYSNDDYGDYPINSLSFVAEADVDSRTVKIPMTLWGDDDILEGILEIKISKGSSSSKGDIVYEVDPDDTVAFSRSDFNDLFESEYSENFDYVVLTPDKTYNSNNGYLYYDYDGSDEERFSKSDVAGTEFTYSKNGTYPIADMTFAAAEDADGEVVTMEFAIYGEDEDDYVEGTLEIRIGDVDKDDDDKGDVDYTVEPGGTVDFERGDFKEFLEDEADFSGSLRWVTFYPGSSYKSSNGVIYYDYDGKNEEKFSKSDLEDLSFYYNSDDYGDYALDDLTFEADDDFDGVVTMDFRAWYSESKYVDGTLTIRAEEEKDIGVGTSKGNILYYTTYSGSVRLNHNDFARFFKKHYPSSTLESVKITSVPSSGRLYYDFYNTSKYGEKVQLTSSNCRDYSFQFSPDSTRDYALSELSFTPNGFNYCPAITFTAYGTGSKSVSGTVLIGVTLDKVPEVYGPTLKGNAASFPASAIASAVSKGTGLTLGGIQLLELPDASQGTVYVGSGSSKASTGIQYGYNSGSQKISQLRFVPASGFTGSVEIPYAAYNTSGNLVASGRFCLGVVNKVPKFSDVTAATWCYKYVIEMNDAGVIDGYGNGTFRPNNTVTYGQALKLIMLAAGYKSQAPTGAHWASGYLSKAKSDGLIRGSIDLDAPITRLAVAQIASKAMKLSTSELSSVKPFTDTSDIYVQALSAAGIVEGYFSNGTSTFKPGNTLTRGQISAIVWRMENYKG